MNKMDSPSRGVWRWAIAGIAQASQPQHQRLRPALRVFFAVLTKLPHDCKVVATALGFIFQVRIGERQKQPHHRICLLSEKQNHPQKPPPWTSPYILLARTRSYDQLWLSGKLGKWGAGLLGLARIPGLHYKMLVLLVWQRGDGMQTGETANVCQARLLEFRALLLEDSQSNILLSG